MCFYLPACSERMQVPHACPPFLLYVSSNLPSAQQDCCTAAALRRPSRRPAQSCDGRFPGPGDVRRDPGRCRQGRLRRGPASRGRAGRRPGCRGRASATARRLPLVPGRRGRSLAAPRLPVVSLAARQGAQVDVEALVEAQVGVGDLSHRRGAHTQTAFGARPALSRPAASDAQSAAERSG